jgi:hypothetical protein
VPKRQKIGDEASNDQTGNSIASVASFEYAAYNKEKFLLAMKDVQITSCNEAPSVFFKQSARITPSMPGYRFLQDYLKKAASL